MKKLNINKYIFPAATTALILVFVSASIMAFAAWRQQGKTTNMVTLAAVKGSIEEQYGQNTIIYPGGTVDKKVQVRNTGTADAITRVKVIPEWGKYGEDGLFVKDESFDMDKIIIEYNTKDWLFREEDGYFYYKSVLAPGELSSPLMEQFTLDGGGVSNEYAGMSGNIRVKMEIVQAGGSGASYWGVKLSEPGIEYVSGGADPLTTTVEFKGKAEGFVFDANAGDLFANYKNMVPGETVNQLVTVTNSFDETVKIFLWAEPDGRLSAARQELAEKLLKEYSALNITDDQGKTIYTGELLKDENGLRTSLGAFRPEETKQLYLSLQISPEVGNDFKELSATLVWGFSCMGEKAAIPATGDNTSIAPHILLALTSAVVLFTPIFASRKIFTKSKKQYKTFILTL